MVNITTGMAASSLSPLSAVSTPQPSSTGISTSSVMTSGRSVRASASPSSPLAASITRNPSLLSIRATSCREVGSSSITSTVPAAPSDAAVADSVAGTAALFSRTSTGKRTVNAVPFPGVLDTVIAPPSISQNIRLIAKPSPVPPYLLAVDASACANATKSRPSCSGVIPMPVSSTTRRMSFPSRVARTVMTPPSVNLLAFDSRLSKICRTRVTSDRIAPSPSANWSARRFPFFSISGATVAATASIAGRKSKVSRCNSILPASIFERSSTSLIKDSR